MSTAGSGASLVLVVGDANPDLVLTGDVTPRFGQAEQLLESATWTIGGSAAITAHAFARLDRPVRLSAAVGDDPTGDRLAGDLVAAGVGVQALLRRPGVPTGLTVVLAQPHDRAILTLPGAIPTLTAEDVATAVEAARPAGLRHVHVSSLFLQPGLSADLAELLREIRGSGVSTSLDTNDDPAGRWLGVEALLPHLDLLLPNRSEAMALAGTPEAVDARSAAALLARRGPLVVVKDGPAGAVAVGPDGATELAAGFPVEAVDTTGAGDTFDAAYVDSWLAGRPAQECLDRAVRAGALAVSALGGTAGQPRPSDLTDALSGEPLLSTNPAHDLESQ